MCEITQCRSNFMKKLKKTQIYFHCDAGFIVDSVKIASDTQEREYALCFATVACCMLSNKSHVHIWKSNAMMNE